jgi:hypothetical protein
MTKNLSHAREKNLMIQAKANTVVNRGKRHSSPLLCAKERRKGEKKKKNKTKEKAFGRRSARLEEAVLLSPEFGWIHPSVSSSIHHSAPPLLIAFATLGVSMHSRRFAALVRKHQTSKASLKSGNLQEKQINK